MARPVAEFLVKSSVFIVNYCKVLLLVQGCMVTYLYLIFTFVYQRLGGKRDRHRHLRLLGVVVFDSLLVFFDGKQLFEENFVLVINLALSLFLLETQVYQLVTNLGASSCLLPWYEGLIAVVVYIFDRGTSIRVGKQRLSSGSR